MARHVFYALHYDADHARVAGILRNPSLAANLEAKPAEWDKLKRSGDFGLKRWLEQQLKGRSCTVVLIGEKTATRPLIQHEIKRSWELKLALLGIHVHALKDAKGRQSSKGDNPFEHPATGLGELAGSIPVYDPPETDSQLAFRHIVDNMAQWAEEAAASAALLHKPPP
ncbi:MAG: TIR domain-containing protein [Polyangiales bacterium]